MAQESFLAVCPKCEKFYKVSDDKVDYYCNHADDDHSWIIRYADTALYPVSNAFTERIKCMVKPAEVKNG